MSSGARRSGRRDKQPHGDRMSVWWWRMVFPRLPGGLELKTIGRRCSVSRSGESKPRANDVGMSRSASQPWPLKQMHAQGGLFASLRRLPRGSISPRSVPGQLDKAPPEASV